MPRFLTTISMVVAVSAPAFALNNHTFVVDPSKSTISISSPVGATTPAVVSSPMVGTFNINLDAPSGSFPNQNWNVLAALDTLNIHNTQDLAFNALSVYNILYPANGFVIDGWNEPGVNNPIPTTTLSGGPNISSGSILTAAHKNLTNYLNGVLQPNDIGWVDVTKPSNAPAINWSIRVSDADWLGVAGAGPTEARVSGFVDGLSGYVRFSFDISGREVPEPATAGLFALGGLGLLRRRNRLA